MSGLGECRERGIRRALFANARNERGDMARRGVAAPVRHRSDLTVAAAGRARRREEIALTVRQAVVDQHLANGFRAVKLDARAGEAAAENPACDQHPLRAGYEIELQSRDVVQPRTIEHALET